MTSLDFYLILKRALEDNAICGFCIFGRTPVTSTDDSCLIPLEASTDQHHYDEADAHCYAYCETSFKELLLDLKEFSLLGFQDIKIFPVAELTNEFHVILRRFSPAQAHRVGSL